MGSRITTIEKAQDNALAQFNVDKQRKNTFLEEQLAFSKKMNAEFELKKKIKGKEDFYKGRADYADKLKKDSEYQKLIEEKRLRENVNNYGDVLEPIRKFFELFGNTLYFDLDLETIKKFNIKDDVFYEDEANKLKFSKFKCYKNKLMVELDIFYIKDVFVKADDFETSKNVVKQSKEFEETLSIETSYGNYEEFRKKFIYSLKGFSSYGVFQNKAEVIETKDYWDFKF